MYRGQDQRLLTLREVYIHNIIQWEWLADSDSDGWIKVGTCGHLSICSHGNGEYSYHDNRIYEESPTGGHVISALSREQFIEILIRDKVKVMAW